MQQRPHNVIEFPLSRRPAMRGCPQCGSRSDVRQVGRLLWGSCSAHELRWVEADLKNVVPERLDRQQMRRSLEYLSSFIEVSH